MLVDTTYISDFTIESFNMDNRQAIQQSIREQGDKIRKLKAEKAAKKEVSNSGMKQMCLIYWLSL